MRKINYFISDFKISFYTLCKDLLEVSSDISKFNKELSDLLDSLVKNDLLPSTSKIDLAKIYCSLPLLFIVDMIVDPASLSEDNYSKTDKLFQRIFFKHFLYKKLSILKNKSTAAFKHQFIKLIMDKNNNFTPEISDAIMEIASDLLNNEFKQYKKDIEKLQILL